MHNFKILFRNFSFLNQILIIFGRLYFRITASNRLKRRRLDLEDYKNISSKFFVIPTSTHWDNDLYGIGYNLLQYINSEKTEIKGFIEHGYYFGSHVSKNTLLHSNQNVITFGQLRENTLLKFNNRINVIKIGPYIQYAKSIYNSKEINNIKRKNGKTLLVFLDHSTNDLQLYHNDDKIINEINKVVEQNYIQTVMICLYWKDIQMGVYKKYEKAGFKIVCSGYRDDIFFLNRLKSLIKISDLTASNEVGTHIPYCLTLDKPHILIDDFKLGNLKQIYLKGEGISESIYYDRLHQINEVKRILKKCNDPAKLKNNNVLDNYFGFSEVKSINELSGLINNL